MPGPTRCSRNASEPALSLLPQHLAPFFWHSSSHLQAQRWHSIASQLQQQRLCMICKNGMCLHCQHANHTCSHPCTPAKELDSSCKPQEPGYKVQGKYLVAADGASSHLRSMLGLQMQGQGIMQHLVNIHFTAPSAWEAARNHPAMLYFTFNRTTIAVLVGHDLERGELVAQVRHVRHSEQEQHTPNEG